MTDETTRWADGALCAQTDPDAFFVGQGGDARPAKAVCMRCEVRTPCREWALGHPELTAFGIWGGTSARQRERLRRERRSAA